MTKDKDNAGILQLLLDNLGVDYTSSYLKRQQEETPYINSLWGIKTVLKLFGVSTNGVRIYDKKELKNISFPFIANTDEGLCVVLNANGDEVEYGFSHKKTFRRDIHDFYNKWDGKALLPSKEHANQEYHLAQHKQQSRDSRIQSVLCCCMVAFLVPCALVRLADIASCWQMWSITAVCCFGFGVSILLLQEQLFAETVLAQRLCGMVKDGNCRSVTHSDAAKTIGGFSWSEVGFSFFATYIICLLCFDGMTGIFTLVSLCALPYTVWSVWYQKYKAKTWCVLCLMVQVSLAFLAFILLSAWSFEVHILSIICFGVIFLVLLLSCNKAMQYMEKARNGNTVKAAFSKLKLSNDILEALSQNEQKNHEDEKLATSIVFGNLDAGLQITIFGNLHCYPCAELHEALRLTQAENRCLRYYFTTLTDKYVESAKKFIAYYNQFGANATETVMDDWYKAILDGKEPIFPNMHIDVESEEVKEEMEKHKNWMIVNKQQPTPAIFINGRKLPSIYSLEDLIKLI